MKCAAGLFWNFQPRFFVAVIPVNQVTVVDAHDLTRQLGRFQRRDTHCVAFCAKFHFAEPRIAPHAERVFQILSTGTSFAPTRPLSFAEQTTTPGKPGRMNVSQGLYKDFGIPGFIMEQRISFNPKLGHLPEIPDRMKFGEELVRALAKAVTQ